MLRAVVVATAVGLCAAAPVHATFPGRNGVVVYEYGAPLKPYGTQETSIRSLDPRTGARRVLRTCPSIRVNTAPACILGPFAVSPDGRTIATNIRYAWVYAPPSIGFLSPDGSGWREVPYSGITEVPSAHYVFGADGLQWQPRSGKLLLHGSDLVKGTWLFEVDQQGVVGDRLPVPNPLGYGKYPLEVASTGAISVHHPANECRGCINHPEYAYALYPDGQGQVVPRCAEVLSWSPYGQRILCNNRAGVHTQAPDGTHRRRVLRRRVSDAAWSPDGKQIAYVFKGDLYTLRLRDRKRRRIVSYRGDLSTNFSQVFAVDWQARP